MLGPPAVGKGAHAQILSAYWEVPHISAGALLRARSQKSDSLGQELKHCVDQGLLVNPHVVFSLLHAELCGRGLPMAFILDGTPRSIDQALMLDEFFLSFGIRRSLALCLRAGEQTVMRPNK
jgi:adenylate kinase